MEQAVRGQLVNSLRTDLSQLICKFAKFATISVYIAKIIFRIIFLVQSEAIPESLKNMLLVMSTAGIFHDGDAEPNAATSDRHYTALWQVTWERIDCFLPNLKRDLFLNRARPSSPSVSVEGKSSGEQADKNAVNVESSEETVTINVVEEQVSEGKPLIS